MGNETSVLPAIAETERAPWIMLTYNPGQAYKGFKFYSNFQVYSNDVLKMADLSVEPQAPSTSQIDFNLPSHSNINTAIRLTSEISTEEVVAALFRGNEENGIVLSAGDKIKILYTWLTKQDILNTRFPLTLDFETVCYQLKKLQDKHNTYAAFFALLCSYAKIPCVIIRGHVKGGRYDPNIGLTDDLMREWNAVLIDGKWRFVDCFWGRTYQGGALKFEPFYLFPDPKHLIYTHFPEHKKWQLLQEPITSEHFNKQPILKHQFFKMQMEIESNPKIMCDKGEQEYVFRLGSDKYYKNHFLCAVSTKNEEKEWKFVKLQDNVQLDFIQIKTDLNDDHEAEENLDTLFQVDEEDIDIDDIDGEPNEDFHRAVTRENTLIWPVDKKLPRSQTRMSVMSNQQLDVYLKINVRFPRKDYYKVEIIGRPKKSRPYDYVAIYYVKVTWVPDWQVFFPIEPQTGWGPNPYFHKCGLKALSHNTGEIKCYVPRWLQIQFTLLPTAPTRHVELTYDLKVQSSQAVDAPSTSYKTNQDEDQEMMNNEEKEIFRPNKEKVINVNVFINTIGEYVLSFNAKLNEDDKSTVINYRIVAERDPKVVQEELAQAAATELRNAIESNDLTMLENALRKTNPYKTHIIVIDTYIEATKLRQRIFRYNQALKKIREIDNNILSQIKTYHKPIPEIVQVMRALFILLGESPKDLQEWDNIRGLITTIGRNSVKRRIRLTKKEEIPREVVIRAREALGDKDTEHTLQQSIEVAAMVYWMESVFMLHQI